MTAFSRLLLFLLFLLPLVYFGASYYNGEDPIGNLKNALGVDQSAPAPTTESTAPSTTTSGNPPATFENVQALRDEITRLKVDLAVANERLARCKTDGVN